MSLGLGCAEHSPESAAATYTCPVFLNTTDHISWTVWKASGPDGFESPSGAVLCVSQVLQASQQVRRADRIAQRSQPFRHPPLARSQRVAPSRPGRRLGVVGASPSLRVGFGT